MRGGAAAALRGAFLPLPSTRSKFCTTLGCAPCGPIGRCARAPVGLRSYFSGRSAGDSIRTAAWRRRATALQRNFDADPNSKQRLSDLLRALNHFDPQQTIRLFERQEPRTVLANKEAVREYIRALVLANRLDFVDLDLVLGQSWRAGVATALTAESNGKNAVDAAAGFPNSVELRLPSSEPLQVQLADSNRRFAWRLARSSLTFLFMVAGMSVLAEGLAGNVQKGFGMGSKKIIPVEEVNTTFDDVKGCDEVKGELQEIILYLKDPGRFTRLGAKLPKGLMMSGPPGTGKTLLARAIAGEAGVPFLQSSGSEFEEMFVGVGARRVRDLFQEARKHAPCIIFIDEIDAVGSKRQTRDNTAVRMTLNQLLVELDGFEQNSGIVVICATNFAESLDKALTRPGRLDKTVVVPFPDLKGRTEILQLYAKKLLLDKNVDLATIARRTAGMTGADLFNILNIAAVRSSADNLTAVPMRYLEEAFDRVVVGLERSNPMSDHEKRLTAFHEGGHTLVSLGCAGADPVHKATIMPRGNALGITWSIPDREKYSERLFELSGRLDVLMGGKAAEELIFGPLNVTAGCTSDLRQATSLARRMVMNFGMANDDGTPAALYLDVEEYSMLSDEAKRDIDQKTQALLTNAYKRAANYLKQHERELNSLAEALIEFETLSADEIKLAIDGQTVQIGELRKEALKTSEIKTDADTPPPKVSKETGSRRAHRRNRDPNAGAEASAAVPTSGDEGGSSAAASGTKADDTGDKTSR
eukprot:TRINITY_DN62312_c0_g1_i1.p1 TRINITY_DN62312_c0_g1~~TRINITY_DN62312_c0_g1_i1.p1  ORF type:complete len:758 (+),score=141.32 TRINITY_DN62312_c0_g1_i1:96-2369(+)